MDDTAYICIHNRNQSSHIFRLRAHALNVLVSPLVLSVHGLSQAPEDVVSLSCLRAGLQNLRTTGTGCKVLDSSTLLEQDCFPNILQFLRS